MTKKEALCWDYVERWRLLSVERAKSHVAAARFSQRDSLTDHIDDVLVGAQFDLIDDVVRNPWSPGTALVPDNRSEAHTSELQSLMRISYAVVCLKKQN